MREGLIYTYTGDGKGKTTAGVGQLVRARGHNLKVCYVSFHKEPKRWGYGEFKSLKKLGVETFFFVKKHPHFYKGLSREALRKECQEALGYIKGKLFKKKYDILMLDEILVAVRDGYIKEVEVLELLESKPKALNMILTGRGLRKKISEVSDLVSKIRKVKHPFDKGIKGRMGIEF